MHNLVHIHSCHGLIHLSIGAVTVRLDEDAFQIVSQEVARFAASQNEPAEITRLTLLRNDSFK